MMAMLGVQAIAQAAAYPGLQAERAAQPEKLAATLASVVVGGDQAAANRATAPQEAMAGGVEEEITMKVPACSWLSGISGRLLEATCGLARLPERHVRHQYRPCEKAIIFWDVTLRPPEIAGGQANPSCGT